MNLTKRKIKQISLLLSISSISGIISPTLFNLKSIQSFAYINTIDLSQEEQEMLNIKEITVGQYHTMFLKTDGTVWATGSNEYGQLGTGNNKSQSTPVKVPIDNVKKVMTGHSYTFFIKNDGTIWACGLNDKGQLGTGNTTNQPTPVKLPISNVKQVISGGNAHTIFIKEDGTVWSCGYNKYGQLGIGNYIDQSTPVKVNITDIKKVIGCGYHTIFFKNDGTIWGTGMNTYGQLGIGNTTNQTLPVKIPVSDVREVVCGYYYTIFTKNDDSIWACGYNNFGQLGIGNLKNQLTAVKVPISNVKTVICGMAYMYFIKEDGTTWATGQNNYGQLGLGHTTSQLSPIQIPIDNVNKIISGGYYHTIFIKSDGTIWVTGQNAYGQLGIGNNINQLNPVKMIGSASNIEDLVLKAESSKLQSDLDNALVEVNELPYGQEKTEYQNRLNILQIEINNIKKATDLLETLEENKFKDDIAKVQDSINLIKDTTIKKQLQDRLDIVKNELISNDVNYSKLLQNAKDKLQKAEISKNNIDITFAQLAIDKLKPEDKTTLQEQLNNLKEQIKLEKEELDYSKLLEDTEIKVTKAESRKKDYDITVAQTSINNLTVDDRQQFQDRLDNLVYNILLEDANLKVINAEDLRTDTSINIAQIAVDKVPHKEVDILNVDLLEETDLLGKPVLQSKLDSLKLSIEEERYLKLLEDANLKVTNAESTKTLKDIKLAQMAIDRLKEIDKTELQLRLDALNQLLKDEEKNKNALKLATTKVEQAEKLNTQKYIDEAKELVENLKPSGEKDLLLDRLTALETSSSKVDEKTKTLIYQAGVYVKQAEALKRESYVIKAQAGIDKIPSESPEKALLQARLNSIKVKK